MITAIFILLLSLLTLTGCGSNGSGSVYVPEQSQAYLNIRGFVNFQNIKFPTIICGNNDYQFRDLSVFNISIQDSLSNTDVSSNGQFSFNELKIKEQIVIQCFYSKNPNLMFEWMGASSSGLTGNVEATVSLYSTARSFIARALRDRHGRRIKPEAIPDKYITETVKAITNVIENSPEILEKTRLDKIDSILSTYTRMADSLAAGDSGNYPSEHVFLFYMAADNDLADYMENTVSQMVKVGLPSDCEIIIGLDTANSLPILNKRGAARYRLGPDGLILLNELGNIDSSDTYFLQQFIETSMREYPAKGYSLILKSHGGVWRDKERVSNSICRAVFLNDTDAIATGTVINVASSIEKALLNNNASNRLFDNIVLDSCNLGSVEIAYEFHNLSKYTIFSQALVPATGIPYEKFFQIIKEKDIKQYDALKIAILFADVFAEKYITTPGAIDTAISVIDNSVMPAFITSLNDFLNKIWEYKNEYIPVIYNIRKASTVNDGTENTGSIIRCFSPTNEFVDLKQLCDLCIYDKQMYFLNDKYDLLKPYFNSLIIRNYHSNLLKNTNGMSITFPEKEDFQYYYISKTIEGKPLQPIANEFFNLKFNSITKWSDILKEMLSY